MNLFIIPSWYPSSLSPVSGIFCKEQALAIGEMNPDWNITISCWGQQAYFLPFSKLKTWPKTLYEYWKNKSYQKKTLRNNVVEYHHPLLHWNPHFVSPESHFKHVLEVNRNHLKRAIMDQKKIDLIHAHVMLPAAVIARTLSHEFGIPYVITEHTGQFPHHSFIQDNGSLKPSIKEACNQAKVVMGVSPSHVEQLKKTGINAIVLPNLVDEEMFSYIPKQRSISDNSIVFFSLCSLLCPEKGVDDLLHAIAEIHHALPLARFRVGGKGNIAGYEALIEKLGIKEKVTLLGNISREQVRREYNECDLFVHPSHSESFGIVYVEALASGKPVIGTRCGGGEYIIEEDQGILIEPKNRKELVLAISEMYHGLDRYDPELIRAKVLSRFSKKVVLEQLKEVYKASLN